MTQLTPLPDSAEGLTNAEYKDLTLTALRELQDWIRDHDDSTIRKMNGALNSELPDPVTDPEKLHRLTVNTQSEARRAEWSNTLPKEPEEAEVGEVRLMADSAVTYEVYDGRGYQRGSLEWCKKKSNEWRADRGLTPIAFEEEAAPVGQSGESDV